MSNNSLHQRFIRSTFRLTKLKRSLK